MTARARLRWTWLLPCFLLVHASVWAVALVGMPATPPLRQVAGEFLSTFALIVVSGNLMLVTRARPLERGFGGLDKLFASHRADGLIAASVLVVHFLVIPKSPGWVPSKPIGYVTLPLIVLSVLLAVAPRAPWRKLVNLRYESWKIGHRSMGLLVTAGVIHSRFAGTIVRRVPLLNIYVYGIAIVGLCCYVYREVLFGQVLNSPRAYQVEGIRHLSDSVLEVVLAPQTAPLARNAGQFAFVTFDTGPSHEQHPFTVSLPPEDRVRFSIKASGDYTDALATGLAGGSTARIEGPYGAFDFRRGKKPQLWLAGGVGITPFLSMAPCLESGYEVTLVWSVRNESDAFYAEELAQTARSNPSVTFVIHPTSALGHLQIADIALAKPVSEHSVFVCGPVPMRREYVRQLLELGVPRREIYFEEFTLR
jgi:predicted ferric reductase